MLVIGNKWCARSKLPKVFSFVGQLAHPVLLLPAAMASSDLAAQVQARASRVQAFELKGAVCGGSAASASLERKALAGRPA